MSSRHKALLSRYDDVFLLDGVRTPFVDYNSASKWLERFSGAAVCRPPM
jgi:hypothetical protein